MALDFIFIFLPAGIRNSIGEPDWMEGNAQVFASFSDNQTHKPLLYHRVMQFVLQGILQSMTSTNMLRKSQAVMVRLSDVDNFR